MLPKPHTCQGCPALDVGRGFVPGEGPPNATLALIGQGPGEVEAHSGRPFSGPSGRKLNLWLVKAGLHRERLWVDNIVRCWLPKNRPPKADEVAHCMAVHGGPALRAIPSLRVVVPVGIPSARHFLGPDVGEGTAGMVVEITI